MVLRAAYEYAGFDVTKHTSADHCLVKKGYREEPFRIPISAEKQFQLQETSFTPIHPPAVNSAPIMGMRDSLSF